MKYKIFIITVFIAFFDTVFFTFEYLEIALYKKEISLLLGLTSATLLYYYSKDATAIFFKKYPVLFWPTLPAPLRNGWKIYSELVNN